MVEDGGKIVVTGNAQMENVYSSIKFSFIKLRSKARCDGVQMC